MGTGQRPPWRSIALVLGLTVAVLLVGLSATGHLGGGSKGSKSTAGRVPTSSASPTGGTPTASASSAMPAGTQLSFSFDSGLTGPTLATHTVEGGHLDLVAHDGGSAVRFPPPCAHYGDPECPRAILEAPGGVALSPGRHDLTWGAAVLLGSDQTTKGSNLLQKGFSTTGGGQFKLQVDGLAGLPSCVLVDSAAGAPLNVATSSVTVADGRWHSIRCARHGTSLTVAVDGTEVGQVAVPAELSVVNDDPVRIGGKGTTPNNDQYHGVIDDVFITINS